MFNRAQIVEQNFINFIVAEKLPKKLSKTTVSNAYLSNKEAVDIFHSQVLARHLDLQARKLKDLGRGFYTIASSGHEANASLGKVFPYTDPALLHYRSGAFVIQRSKQLKQQNITENILFSFLASSKDPTSGGRHKVFGSLALNIPPQTSTIASHLPKSVGLALAITRAKELKIKTKYPYPSLVYCSFGDASYNHASAQTAINAAEWMNSTNYPLAIVFVCEDNGLGISVNTPDHWIQSSVEPKKNLYYIKSDGLSFTDVYLKAKQADEFCRKKRKPVFLHLKCNRLLGHAGADIESVYRSQKEIESSEFNDPLLHSARILLEENIMSKEDLVALYQQTSAQVQNIVDKNTSAPTLQSAKEVMHPLSEDLSPSFSIKLYSEERKRKDFFANEYTKFCSPLNLSQHINFALQDILLATDNTLIFGEDVGKKGGVYHVTQSLQKKFGSRRVFDTILDETMIFGLAIGLAQNNFLPIPEIQFLAYYHNAQDQIRGEAITQGFFSKNQFTNPMLIRIPSFAYQKGFGGHFHNDNSITALMDLPGVVIACPSSGKNAAPLLRSALKIAWQERKVVFFLEPIALYKTKDLHQANDQLWLCEYPKVELETPIGQVESIKTGEDIHIISYANGYYLSRKAQKILKEKHNIGSQIIDIQWLKPLPIAAIDKLVPENAKVLIVDECRDRGSLSERLYLELMNIKNQKIQVHRLTAKNSFIPLGQAAEFLLPSTEQVVNESLAMLKKKPIRSLA